MAWGLEQTKFFTLGCKDLKVITDHQPLISIISNKRLDEIENTRLFRIKNRTLMGRFDIGDQVSSIPFLMQFHVILVATQK